MGAALLALDGAIIQGCSVDNASYGESRLLSVMFAEVQKLTQLSADTICAERVAIVKAVVSPT